MRQFIGWTGWTEWTAWTGMLAHSTVPGAGDFASGLLHPILTPAHLIVLLSLGIWLGQRPPLALRGPALVFAALSGAALLLTLFVKMPANLQPELAVVSFAGGLLVALEATLPPWLRLLPFAAAALAVGCDSSADVAPGVSVGKVLCGTWLSLSLVLINVAFYVSLRPEKPWARIGLRVLGSWIVAISFLLIAFALRPPAADARSGAPAAAGATSGK